MAEYSWVATEERLVEWGHRVGREASEGLVLALRGSLGAGKSVLARAVASGAGVEGRIPSPTFNLLLRYAGRGGREVVHVDLYRIEDPAELGELGWDELGSVDEILLVEWPERAGLRLPEDRWDVQLRPVAGSPHLREVSVRRHGSPAPLPRPPGAL